MPSFRPSSLLFSGPRAFVAAKFSDQRDWDMAHVSVVKMDASYDMQGTTYDNCKSPLSSEIRSGVSHVGDTQVLEKKKVCGPRARREGGREERKALASGEGDGGEHGITAWCKKNSPCLKFPPHFCQAKWPAHAQPIGPDGTCVTKLSSINFARPCTMYPKVVKYGQNSK